jgi:predicted DNA-binding transcriptional regulator AlpA
MAEKLIDINELSEIFGIPTKTIRNKLSDGSWELPPLRIGKALRWSPADVDAYLRRLKSRAAGETA